MHVLFIVQLNSLIESHPEFGSEMAILVDLLFANVNKLREVLPLHLLALSVEVKPSVLKVVILLFELFVKLGELSSYPQLGSFLVN